MYVWFVLSGVNKVIKDIQWDIVCWLQRSYCTGSIVNCRFFMVGIILACCDVIGRLSAYWRKRLWEEAEETEV